MTLDGRRIVVTGAGGFIGSQLSQFLVSHVAAADTRFVLNDMALPNPPADRRIRQVVGDFSDPAVLSDLLRDGADVVFHLAGVLGGAAEEDFSAARRTNLDATMAMLDALRRPGDPLRLVYASSIAVFGPPLPDLIDDETAPFPVMTYGAQKRMIEIALDQLAARGWIDGIAVRLPGIVARPGADSRLKTAFIHALFSAFAQGKKLTLPVSEDGATWLISVQACVEALVHAASIPSDQLNRCRSITLPAQRVRFGDLVMSLQIQFPDSATTISYAPDALLDEQFGRHPRLVTPYADALGFRHDGDLPTLVTRALITAGLTGCGPV